MELTPQIGNDLQTACDEKIAEIYQRLYTNEPNYGVSLDCFKTSVNSTLCRFIAASDARPSDREILSFLDQLQSEDLYLALACAAGNERAWWDFDREHRPFMQRVARQLARTEVDAEEIIGVVYEQLYGTRIVDGQRQSKFSSYSGRGNLRGWLRTVIWHSLVDRHRAGHDEVSLDQMTENVGEGAAQSSFLESDNDNEPAMLDQITRERYRKAATRAIQSAFAQLEDHERLILLLYHVENLKLREIAKLVEKEDSPLRAWFQRKAANRSEKTSGRIHESTIMRWLEKCYSIVLENFKKHLSQQSGLKEAEIAECLKIASEITDGSFFVNLSEAQTASD